MTNLPKKSPTAGLSRREFVGAAAAVAAFTFVPKHVLGAAGQPSANNKLNIAGIGVGGRGASDIDGVASENIASLCDADLKQASGTIKKHPNAKIYRDFREMLEKEDKNIDAVVIGAPDHIHAPAAIMAMKMGKHVYCEKPMAHTIYEARRMTQVAKETGVVTQMGNQGHAGEGLRLYWEYIHAGMIGTVKEVHVWSDRAGTPERAWWPQGIDRPQGSVPVPENLDWDLWLGPGSLASLRQVPQWQGRRCHVLPVQLAWLVGFRLRRHWRYGRAQCRSGVLRPGSRRPDGRRGQTSPVNDETLPVWNIITFEFPAKGDRPAVKMTWYDGAKLPPKPADLDERLNLGDNGILFVGDKCSLLGGSHAGVPRIIPETKRKELGRPPKSLPRSPGHHQEWIDACKARKPEDAKSGFWYAGPFVEALLVGNLAVRLQKRVEWDAEKMRSPNCPEADNYITKFYRNGFNLV